MENARNKRVLRQHVQTDRLLGAEAVPRAAALFAAKPQPAVMLDRATRVQQLERLDCDEVRGCTKCELHQSRTQTVFGEGDPEARLMFIGEGPGQNEDEQGRPFVGRAGELLNKQIAAMGLRREQVFIANVVKCRPPNNRAPAPAEVEACSDFLTRQIQIIQPEVIMTLGAPAAKLVLKTREGITRLRGTWCEYDGLVPDGPVIPVMPTFHPAYLLRAYTPENRQRVWSDLQQVMQRLGLGGG
jgi:DNA polymerase